MNPIRIYWSDCGFTWYNFGDFYSKVLVEKLSGRKTLRYNSPKDAEIVCGGSIIQQLPYDYDGYIYGCGYIADWYESSFQMAKISALRGKLTARRLGVDVPLGDPLLLVEKPDIEPKYELGILPHYVDAGDPDLYRLARSNDGILVIDICAPDVIERIASCKNIISSSLHGVVIADALDIPNQWTLFSEGKIAGSTFKYRDYYSVFGIQDPIPYRYDKSHGFEWILRRIDWTPKDLTQIKKDLLDAFPKVLCG